MRVTQQYQFVGPIWHALDVKCGDALGGRRGAQHGNTGTTVIAHLAYGEFALELTTYDDDGGEHDTRETIRPAEIRWIVCDALQANIWRNGGRRRFGHRVSQKPRSSAQGFSPFGPEYTVEEIATPGDGSGDSDTDRACIIPAHGDGLALYRAATGEGRYSDIPQAGLPDFGLHVALGCPALACRLGMRMRGRDVSPANRTPVPLARIADLLDKARDAGESLVPLKTLLP